MIRAAAWLVFALSPIGVLWGCYAFVFFAWLTATPLAPPELRNAQDSATLWLMSPGLNLIVAVVALSVADGYRRRGS